MTPKVGLAAALLNAIKAKKPSEAPLAENVSYESPLSGERIQGREHVVRFMGVYLPVIHDIQIERHIEDGDDSATVVRAETSFGPISLVYVCRAELGKITEIQAFYDPRGFLAGMGGQATRSSA